MTINNPKVDVEVLLSVWLVIPGSGCNVYLSEDEAKRYRRNPDLFAAQHFGLTLAEYREWVVAQGRALCSERTKSGRLCRNSVEGVPPHGNAKRWKELNRSGPCFLHGGERRR